MKIYLRLLSYVRPYAGLFALSIIGFFVFASAQPAFASILKFFVEGLSDPEYQPFVFLPSVKGSIVLAGIPIALVVIAIWQGIGFYLGNVFIAKVSLRIVRDLRVAIFERMLISPTEFFDTNNSGKLVALVLYNVSQVTGAATDAVKVLLREGLTVAFLIAFLLWSNWKLTVVLLLALPLIGFLVQRASVRLRRQSRRIQESLGEVTHITTEVIQGHKVVKTFGGVRYESQRFREATDDSLKQQMRMVRISDTFTPVLQLVTYASMAGLLFLVILFRGDSSVGDLVAYVTAAGLLPKPIRQLSEVSATIQKGLAAAESVFMQLDRPSEPDHGNLLLDRASGAIEFFDVTFTYPSHQIPRLSNVTFRISPGQMVALVGRSGSGKSTLASLLLRFYRGWTGDIRIDGVPIQDLRLQNLRANISFVTQQVTLFNDTIANNIAYGDLQGTPREQIEAAAEAACATEFIAQLPNGFDTLVGENGVLLSGGQRQRIAIARAILKNAPILILDEATSALDTESERHIQRALEAATQGRTTLVIAHRLSTIERADLILVMEDGQIIERGTHAELLKADGAYAKLHAMQFE